MKGGLIFKIFLKILFFSGVSESGPVNVFHINDKSNVIARNVVPLAFKSRSTAAALGEVYTVEIDGQQSEESFNTICEKWAKAITNEPSKRPNFIFDTTTHGPGAEVVQYFTVVKGLPTLSTQYGEENDMYGWRNLNEKQKKFLIQVRPPSDVLPQIIRILNEKHSITNAAILFDDTFVMDYKYKSLLLLLPCRYMIRPIKPGGTALINQLKEIRREGMVNYIILGTINTINYAFDAGCSLNYGNKLYGWYAITLDHQFKEINKCSKSNYVLVRPVINNSQLIGAHDRPAISNISTAFFINIASTGVAAVLEGLGSKNWPKGFNYTNCTDKTVSNRQYNFLELLQKKPNSTWSHLKWGTKNGQRHHMFSASIDEYYGSPFKSNNIGVWKVGEEDSISLVNKQLNILKQHAALPNYRIVTITKPPFMMKINNTNIWQGLCMDILNRLRRSYPFNYEIYEVPDNQYGNMNVDGTWNGMIKELVDGRADIALGAISVMAERESVIDYTVPYYEHVGLSILMRRPPPEIPLFKFLIVMEGELWSFLFILYFSVCGFIWVFDRYSPYSYYNNQLKYQNCDEKRRFNIKECLWFSLTSLTPQGGGELPKNLSGQIVAGCWWVFGFVFVTSYTANLAAFLTSARLETPIQSLSDLMAQYKYQFAPILNSTEYRYFERMAYIEETFFNIWKKMYLKAQMNMSNTRIHTIDYPLSDTYIRIFKHMQDSGFPKDMNEALARLRGEIEGNYNLFAFIGDSTDIKYQVLTNCDFYKVGEDFSQKPYAFAVQKGSPLKEIFSGEILELMQSRDLERMKENWWDQHPRRQRCAQYDEENDGVSIKNIGGVFIVVSVGIGISCLILFWEYFYFNWCQLKVEAIYDQWKGKRTKEKGMNRRNFQNVKSFRHVTSYPRKRF